MSDLVPASPRAARIGNGGTLAGVLPGLRTLLAQPAARRALPALGWGGALLMTAGAWYSFQSPSQRSVFEGLTDSDKAAVADALQAASINHSVDRSTGAVTVAETDFYKARMMLAAQGLPKAAPSGDSLLGALPLGASRALEGETLRAAREMDLSRTIEAIDTVKKARVHLAIPEPSAFLREQAPLAASVMLTLQPGRTLGDAQVRAITHLVASAVPGLGSDQVSIVDQSGMLVSRPEIVDERSLAQQSAIEERAQHAIRALLEPMLGAANFTAEIHADLDPSESQSTRESYPKDDRALRREEGNRSSGSGSPPAAVGIPGTLANQPPPASQVAASPGGTMTPLSQTGPGPAGSSASDETYARSFDVGREISVTRQPTGRLRRLSVAVALRDAKGARPRAAQELATLEQLVKGAIGFDASRGDVVAIASRPFAEAEPISEPPFYDRPVVLTIARQVGALIAAILAFFLVGRPLLRALRARAARGDEEATIARGLLNATADRAPITIDMIESAPSYEARANLVREFVRQDPAKASSVVRELMAATGDD